MDYRFDETLAGFAGLTPRALKVVESASTQAARVHAQIARSTFDAVREYNDLTCAWTRESVRQFGEIRPITGDRAKGARALNEYAAQSAASAIDQLTATVDLARKAHTERLEILAAAGKAATQDTVDFMNAVADASFRPLDAATRASSAK